MELTHSFKGTFHFKVQFHQNKSKALLTYGDVSIVTGAISLKKLKPVYI